MNSLIAVGARLGALALALTVLAVQSVTSSSSEAQTAQSYEWHVQPGLGHERGYVTVTSNWHGGSANDDALDFGLGCPITE